MREHLDNHVNVKLVKHEGRLCRAAAGRHCEGRTEARRRKERRKEWGNLPEVVESVSCTSRSRLKRWDQADRIAGRCRHGGTSHAAACSHSYGSPFVFWSARRQLLDIALYYAQNNRYSEGLLLDRMVEMTKTSRRTIGAARSLFAMDCHSGCQDTLQKPCEIAAACR